MKEGDIINELVVGMAQSSRQGFSLMGKLISHAAHEAREPPK
jgi:hypothetical protein